MISFLNKIISRFSYRRLSFNLRLLQEKLKSVDFSSVLQPEEVGLNPDIAFRSSPSGNKYLENVLENLNISKKDKIIDVGCGKGSAMRAMLKYPFSSIDGVELSEYIAGIAKKNFEKLKVDRCTILMIDATEFKEYDPYNFVYFYNPFPSKIMSKVMDNLIDSIKRVPRKLVIIYNNPVCHSDIIQKGGFSKISEYPGEWGNKIYVYSNEK